MHTGAIIVTEPGFVPPEGYLRQALGNNPSCAGVTVFSDGKLHVSRVKPANPETLNKIFNAFKDRRVCIHMGNYPSGFQADDIQPFVLVEDADKKPQIVAMLDGDFISPNDKSTHSSEFFAAINHLRPLFQQLWRLTKGDVASILEEVRGDATRNAILNTFFNRGSVTLIFGNGEVYTIAKNDMQHQFPWGWVSNKYMYSEDKKPVSDNPLEALLGSDAVVQEEPTIEHEPVKEPDKVVEPAKVAEPAKEGTEIKYVQCPKEIKKPHKVEGWYRHNANWAPPNYMSYPSVEVRPKGQPKSKAPSGPVIKDVKDIGAAMAAANNGKPTETAPVPEKRAPQILPSIGDTPEDIAKRTPPKHIPAIKQSAPPVAAPAVPAKVAEPPVPETLVPSRQPEGPSNPIPILAPDTQKYMVDKFLKEPDETLDRSGNPIFDPKKMQAMMEKYPSFAETCGIKMEDTYNWSLARIQKLAKERPDALVNLYFWTRYDLMSILLSEKAADKPKIPLLPPRQKKVA